MILSKKAIVIKDSPFVKITLTVSKIKKTSLVRGLYLYSVSVQIRGWIARGLFFYKKRKNFPIFCCFIWNLVIKEYSVCIFLSYRYLMKYFVFIDETGTSLQDEYFWLWCLIIPQHKIWEYNSLLQRKYDQIIGMMKMKETELLSTLSKEQYTSYLQWRKAPYEMKFKNINATTLEGYRRLFSQYFKLTEAKFCALVINRRQYPFPQNMTYFDAYLNQLTMLLKNNFSEQDEFVILPDSITVPVGRNYESELTQKLQSKKRDCFWVCRIESHSSLFLQMIDCLIWAVVYDNKHWTNSNKVAIIEKIKKKINKKSLSENITVHAPNYFSIWKYHQSW